MLEIAEKFPEQVEEALKILKKIKIRPFQDINKILVSGMGASAISADILAHFSNMPFFVVRDYYLPPFVDENTLFIAVSYSGNTEETISCYKEAIKRKCKTLAITTGGKLGEIAKNKILIPKGMQPRAAIAYLLFPLAKILKEMSIINVDFDETIYTIKSNKEKIKKIAKEIANEIEGFPIIYGYGVMESVAKRWRQQFNENAKMFAFDFPMTECNHNELEAWERKTKERKTCIFLRSRNENERVKIRYEFMKKVYDAKIIEVFSFGKDRFSEAISMLYIGDFASLYRAEINGIDAEPVNLIMKLKEELSQHSRSSS